jgi:NADPH:quinone reductase-like Zn-dependent oxidoreductase
MRAFQLKSQTGIEALQKVEIAEPKPARGQVAVRVSAC